MDNPNQDKHGSSNGPRRFRPQARSNKPRRLRRVLSSGLTRFRQVSKRKRWDILHFVKASVESETVTFLAHASCKLKSTPNENVCCGASFERNLQRFLYTRMTSVQTQNDGIIDWFRNGDVPLTRPLVFQRCPSGEFLTFSQGHMLNAKPYVVAMLTLQCYTRKMAANAFSQSNQRDVKGHQGTSRDIKGHVMSTQPESRGLVSRGHGSHGHWSCQKSECSASQRPSQGHGCPSFPHGILFPAAFWLVWSLLRLARNDWWLTDQKKNK